MARQISIVAAAFVGGVAVTIAVSAMWGPRSYEDCILQRLDTEANQTVAGLIMISCQAKFPRRVSENQSSVSGETPSVVDRFRFRDLSVGERIKLNWRGETIAGTLLGGPIHNGLDSVHVSEIILEIGYVTDTDTLSVIHRPQLSIDPLSTEDLQVEILRGHGRADFWRIVAASGRTVRR